MTENSNRLIPATNQPSRHQTGGYNWQRGLISFTAKYGTICGIVFVCTFFTVAKPSFASVANVLYILQSASILAIVSLGMAIVMLAKGIDVSVGQTMGLAGVLVSTLLLGGYSAPAAILLALLFGLAIGLVNAICSVWLRISPIVSTLAVLLIVKSVELVYTDGGKPVYLFTLQGKAADQFFFLGQGHWGPFSGPIIVAAIVSLITYLVMGHTKVGRYMYALGDNVKAAALSGVNTKLYYGLSYVFCGLLAALGGIVMASRITGGVPRGGEGYLLDSWVAVLLSGTMFGEGEINIGGTIIGAITVTLLVNGLAIIGANEVYQNILKGLLMLMAVAIGSLRQTK